MNETLIRIINFIKTVNSRTEEVSNRLSALEGRVAQVEVFQQTPQIDITAANALLAEINQ